MKKTITTFILFLSIVNGALAQISSGDIAINLQKGKFSINRSTVTPGWDLSSATNVLGKNDRLKPGFNITHTYDELGIVLFEPTTGDKAPTGHMSEFQVYLSAPDETNTVIPSGLFRGSITVDNIQITRNSTMANLRKMLLAYGYTESQSYTEHNFRFASAGIYMYILCDASEMRVIKVSMGKDKKSD